jgi:hypothetical protein
MADDIRQTLASQKIEIEKLYGEILATHAVITNVLGHLALVDPRMAGAIRRGFDDAARLVENFAIQQGKSASPHHTVKALDMSRACAPQRSAIKTSRNTSFSWLGASCFRCNIPPRSTFPTSAIALGFAA